MPTRRSLAVALLAVLALGVVVMLGLRSQVRDAGENAQLLDEARRLREIDTHVDRAVLGAHDGLSTSYDELTELLAEMHATLAVIERAARRLDDPEIARAVKRAHDAVVAKAALVDAFESRNSVVRNSVASLARSLKRAAAANDPEVARRSLVLVATILENENNHMVDDVRDLRPAIEAVR